MYLYLRLITGLKRIKFPFIFAPIFLISQYIGFDRKNTVDMIATYYRGTSDS